MNFSLVEVLLDKGVSEREMRHEEKPWEVVQESRKVGLSSCNHGNGQLLCLL